MLEVLDTDFIVVIVWIGSIWDRLCYWNVLTKVIGMGNSEAREGVYKLANTCASNVVALSIELWQWTVGIVWCCTKVIWLTTWSWSADLCWSAALSPSGPHCCSSGFTLFYGHTPEDLAFLTFGLSG